MDGVTVSKDLCWRPNLQHSDVQYPNGFCVSCKNVLLTTHPQSDAMMLATAAAMAAEVRSVMYTLAPMSVSSCAVWKPMPRPLPVNHSIAGTLSSLGSFAGEGIAGIEHGAARRQDQLQGDHCRYCDIMCTCH